MQQKSYNVEENVDIQVKSQVHIIMKSSGNQKPGSNQTSPVSIDSHQRDLARKPVWENQ
jgi:hypothetical protein